ncbi:MAG: hypothetical protein LBR00_05345, partial [Clostridiales Family XIII bacterium]|nr:hypothetical protein [Clostridiales Family XIII bacterium]
MKMKQLFSNIMDALTGSESRMREMYRAAFADQGADALIAKVKKQNKTIVLALALVLLLIVALWASEALSGEEPALDLAREEPGGRTKAVSAEAYATYEGAEVTEDVTLTVRPRAMDEDESFERIEELKRRLPREILGENTSADCIWADLTLPRYDAKSGADIAWRTDDAQRISADGIVDPLRNNADADGDPVILTAEMRIGAVSDTLPIALVPGPPPEDFDFSGALRAHIRAIASAASDSDEGPAVVLSGSGAGAGEDPDADAPDGLSIEWRAPAQKGHLAEMLVIVVALAICVHARFKSIEKKIAEAHRQIERDFPDFIGKLGLLLGAGLVITSAIDRITEDYIAYRRDGGKRQLYEELVAMRERIRAGNTPLVHEFSDIARRSGLREVMRFSSVLADNIDKGS